MLTKVEIRTVGGSLLSLPLRDPSNGLLIEDIEGLEPVKATIVSSSFAQQDGAQYQSSKREPRNIVLKLDLEPDYVPTTTALLRRILYSYFMPKSVVNMRFFREGLPEVDIQGRVESFDAPIFTKDPQATISMLCLDPDFYDPDLNTITGETVDDDDDTTIVYAGDVETGFLFTLFVDRTLDEFTLYHKPPNKELVSLSFVSPLISGDLLTINTVTGDKYATLIRAGVTSSVLYGVAPYSKWIELEPGSNLFRAHAEGASIDYQIEYITRYGGL